MTKATISAIVLLMLLASGVRSVDLDRSVAGNITSMPLAFTENRGQWDERILFRADAGRAKMWFAGDGAYYQFVCAASDDNTHIESDRTTRDNIVESMMIKATFKGADPDPRLSGRDMLEYRCNYFIGNDPTRWRTNVANYGAVVYEEIYPGIDLKYYGNGKEMEYDFIVSPGADPSLIRVQYDGVESVAVNEHGELVIQTGWGEVIERRPAVYQEQGGARVPVEGRYEMLANHTFGFSLPTGYDQTLALVIDPALTYSTYIGDDRTEQGWGIALDDSGYVYVTGWTDSYDYPTQDPFQSILRGIYDVFVTKLDITANRLVYSTYLGGTAIDWAYSIAVDGSGCAYVTGYTCSPDYPIWFPYQPLHGDGGTSYDAFVTKLHYTGDSLVYSTFLGGLLADEGSGIAVDASECAYVAGHTKSPNFPTLDPYQTYQGDGDAFVTKFSGSGTTVTYSTYLGSSQLDYASAIAVDESGCAFTTGTTWSPWFPTQDPYQTYQGNGDAFVTRLNPFGNNLEYSTFLGGSSREDGYGIALDGSGCAYVTGRTESLNFPTEYPYQETHGGGGTDAFVAKLNSLGNDLDYGTYLGGGADDEGLGIAVDASDCAFVTGWTESTDFPIVEEIQSTNEGLKDAFVTDLFSTGDSLIYSTYLGGTGWDECRAIVMTDSSSAIVTGVTSSDDFPTEREYQSYQGDNDVFVSKLSMSCCRIRGDIDHNGQLDAMDLIYFVDWLWRGGPPPPCMPEADLNADGTVDPYDLLHLVDYVWGAGPPPVPCP